MELCANCTTEIDPNYHEVNSVFSIVDKRDKTTVLNVISELFGVSHKLRTFLQNYQFRCGDECVPQVCQRCIKILTQSFKLRKQFLSLCHPEGTLRLILFEDLVAGGNSAERSRLTQSSSRSLKKCSVLIKRLPHVYEDRDRDEDQFPLICVIKTEPVHEGFVDENFDQYDNDNDHFSDGGVSWSEMEQSRDDSKPGTSREDEHMDVDSGSSSPVTRSSRVRSKFKCQHCFKIFTVASARDKHELVHEDNSSDSKSELEDTSGSEVEKPESETEESESDVHIKEVVTRKRKRKAPAMSTPPACRSLRRRPPPKVDHVSEMYEEIGRDTREFACDKCDERFHFKAELTSHLVTCHDELTTPLLPSAEYEEEAVLLKCPECGDYESKYPLELTRHIFRIHTKEDQYKCRKCPFKSTDIIETRRHCVSHVMDLDIKPARGEAWTCAVCNVTFKDNSNVRRHVSEHVRPFECPECDATYGRTDYMDRHRRLHHEGAIVEPDEEPVPDPVTQETKKQKIDHSKYIIETTATFECNKCEEKFNFQAHLLGHGIIAHSTDRKRKTDERRLFNCTSCRFRTRKPSVLLTHFFCHTKEKMYKCDFPDCDYETARSVCITSHFKSVHAPRGDKDANLLEIGPRIEIDDNYQRIDGGHSQVMCDQCLTTFPFQAELHAHVVTHHSQRSEQGARTVPLKCNLPNCEFESKYNYEFTNHMFVTHTNEPRFKCSWEGCSFVSVCEVDVRKHIVVTHFHHKRSSMNQCVLCSERMASEKMMEKHINSHIRPYECQYCGQLFGVTSHWRRHRWTHNRNISDVVGRSWQISSSESHACPVEGCGKVYPFKALLLTHSAITHNGPKQKSKDCYTCNLCQETRKSREGLEKHFFQCHTKEKRFKCPTCGDTFVTVRAMELHKKDAQKHHAVKRTVPEAWLKYECTICSKRFLTAYILKNHQVVHSKEQKFKCPVCSKSFGWKMGFKTHCRKAHKLAVPDEPKKTNVLKDKVVKILSESTYKCEQCSQEFGFEALLLVHKQVDHVMTTTDQGTRSGFPCGLCSYVNTTRQDLEIHYRRAHTKEMAFRCAFQNCSFAAATTSQVRQHLQSAIHKIVAVADTPKLQCQFCGSFFTKYGLGSHVKRKHGDEVSML